jgi:hypothetical protein
VRQSPDSTSLLSSLTPEQALSNLDAMVVQSARGESQCIFCHRPWFGLVAYCPYCGRRISFRTISQGPDYRPPREVASEREDLRRQAGELPVEPDRPARPLSKTTPALTLLLKTVVVGVSALLMLWIGIELLASRTNETSSAQKPILNSDIAFSPRWGPSTSSSSAQASSVAQVPSGPPPANAAAPENPSAQVPPDQPRTNTAVPPNPSRSLCSAADEKAGLCKSQQ